MMTPEQLRAIQVLHRTQSEGAIAALLGIAPKDWIAAKTEQRRLAQIFDHPTQQPSDAELRKNPPKSSPPQERKKTAYELWDGYGTAPDRSPALRAAESAMGINSNPSQSSMTPAQWRRWTKEAPAPAGEFGASPEFLSAPTSDPILLVEAQERVDFWLKSRLPQRKILALAEARDELKNYIEKLWPK